MNSVDEKFLDEMFNIFKDRKHAEPELGFLLCKVFLDVAKKMNTNINDENINEVASFTSQTWQMLLEYMLIVTYYKRKHERR